MTIRGARLTCLLLGVCAADTAQQREAFAWNERGVQASAAGNFNEAEHDYQMALGKWRALGLPYDAHAAITLYNLGQAYVGQGRWRESAPALEESIRLARRSLGLRDARTLATLNSLGRVYMVTGEFGRSAEVLLEALSIEREKTPDGTEVAQTLGSLACLRIHEGKLEEAQALADEALAITIRVAGEDAADAATMYAIAGSVQQRAGRPERALPLLRKAHAIYDLTITPGDLRYSSLLSSEGLALIDDGKFVAGERELRRALNLLEGCAAQCGLALAIAENNFGVLRMAQRRYSEADQYFRSALAREEQYTARPGGDLLQTLKLLAELRDRQHRYKEAAALKERIATAQSSFR
jgi:tetratricopeptide (TPR) repeat protein